MPCWTFPVVVAKHSNGGKVVEKQEIKKDSGASGIKGANQKANTKAVTIRQLPERKN
jgi:hypothetical protein